MVVSVGVVALAGSASIVAVGYERTCYDPLTEMVRREVASGVKDEFLAKKAAELPFLEQLESAMCARSSMTKAELVKEHEAVKPPPRGDDLIPTPVPNSPIHPVGVIYDERDPSFLMLNPPTGKGFVVTAELLAEVGGEKYSVYTGYQESDPLQGEVYASAPGGAMDGTRFFFPTPEPTGPTKMVAIKGSVLTIVTLGGTYEKREAGTGILLGTVTTKGGSRYEFDLETRSFR